MYGDKEYFVYVVETKNGFLQQDGTEVSNPGDVATYPTYEDAEKVADFHGRGIVEMYSLTEAKGDITPWD